MSFPHEIPTEYTPSKSNNNNKKKIQTHLFDLFTSLGKCSKQDLKAKLSPLQITQYHTQLTQKKKDKKVLKKKS